MENKMETTILLKGIYRDNEKRKWKLIFRVHGYEGVFRGLV